MVQPPWLFIVVCIANTWGTTWKLRSFTQQSAFRRSRKDCSAMAAFHNRSSSSNNPHLSNDEYKASYDDLIDQYAAPYGANVNHQTYALQSSPSQHRRGPSYPLKPPFSSKQSDSSYDLTAVAYPPASLPKDADTRSFWQKVCAKVSCSHVLCLIFCADPPRLDCV